MVSTRWLLVALLALVAVAALGCFKSGAPKGTGAADEVRGGTPPPNAVGEPQDRTLTPGETPGTPAATPPSGAVATGGKWTGTAQDFEVKGFDGKTFRISDYAGQPVVLNFWAAWCPPCVGEFPEFQEVYNAKKGQFVMISVAVDAEQDPETFVKDKGYNWIFAHDTDGGKKYNVQAIPQTYFISPSGSIVDSQAGGMDRNTFEQKLSKLLAQ